MPQDHLFKILETGARKQRIDLAAVFAVFSFTDRAHRDHGIRE